MKNARKFSCADILLYVSAAASTFYLLMLGWYNVPTLDDYGYIQMAEDLGLFGSIKVAYEGWQCRFTTFFMNNIVYLLFGRSSNLILVTILMLLIGYLSVGALFIGILKKHDLILPTPIMIASTILLVNIGLMSYIEPNTFFWLCALNYTFSTWMAVLLVYGLFYCTLGKMWRGMLIVFTSLYISGTAENFTPMVILALGIVWIIRLVKSKDIRWWKNDVDSYLFVSLLIMTIGFVILLIGPGNRNRIESYGAESDLIGRLSVAKLITKTAKASAILSLRVLSRSLYYLVLIPVFIYVGSLCKANAPLKRVKIRHFVWLVLVLIAFVIIDVAACVFGTGWYAPPRAFSFLSFVIIIPFMCVAFAMGMNLSNEKGGTVAAMTAFLIISASSLFFCIQDQPIAKKYHDEVICRNRRIEGEVAKDRTEALVVDAISEEWSLNTYSVLRNMMNSVLGKSKRYEEYNKIYMPSLLSSDPNDWKNTALKGYYHAKFDIICNENERLDNVSD